MAKPFDAASKHIVDFYPDDWLALGGLPPGMASEVVDSDLSAVSTAADKLIRVSAPDPYLAHLEFQSGDPADLDERILLYSVLGRKKLGLPVMSVAFLLRRQALTPAVTGRVSWRLAPDQFLEFGYKLVRVWELPPKILLTGGIGTLPLAPISNVTEVEVPSVIAAMKHRLDTEVPPQEAREMWASTQILMGLRYPGEMVKRLLRGVQDMEESTTYQAIIEKGVERGLERGRAMEAKEVLLRLGRKQWGDPDRAISEMLNSINDRARLESLMDRLLDGTVKSWAELFA